MYEYLHQAGVNKDQTWAPVSSSQVLLPYVFLNKTYEKKFGFSELSRF